MSDKSQTYNKSNQSELISVIMAAYNAEDTIAESLRSALAQSYRNIEIIVVNDASTDSTALIAQDFSRCDNRVRVISHTINRGVSASRKDGLASARGGWIAILDSDDLWSPKKLELELSAQRETNADLIYTGSAFINETGTPKDWCLRVPETVTYHSLLKQNIVSNSSVLVKKELLETYFVNNDRIHEDFAVWLHMLKNGVAFRGIDQPLLIYRIRESSKSGNKLKSAVMNWKTYRYMGLSVPASCYYMFCYIMRGLSKYRHLQ